MIFRLILIIILFIITFVGYVYLNFNAWWVKITFRLFFTLCNIQNITINGVYKLDKLYNSNKKFLIVSNHKSMFDIFLSFYIYPNICILTSKAAANIFPLFNNLNKKIGNIVFDHLIKNQNITDLIYDKVNNRKAKDNMLVIYPDGMNPIPIGKNIANFKTGAFRHKFDILPIVIKYKNWSIDPTHYWYKGEHPFIGFSKVLLDGNCEVTVDVMDLVSCEDDMSVEEYRDYVYDLMDTRYSQL